MARVEGALCFLGRVFNSLIDLPLVQNVEISNGRLAMLGILGMFASEVIHGEALYETKFF